MENPLLNLDEQFQVPQPESVFSMLFPEKQAPMDPYTKLRVKIAKTAAERAEKRRKVDEATMPFVQRDIAASQVREFDISQKINEAMEVLKQPMPVLGKGPNEAELYSAALGGLLAPGNVDNILDALAKVSGARNQQEFDAKLAQYGMTRESTLMALKQLQGEMNYERDAQFALRKRQWDLEDQSAQDSANIEKWASDAELNLQLQELESQDKRYVADLKAQVDQMKLDTANMFKEVEFALKERDVATREANQKSLDKNRTDRLQWDKEKFGKLSADQKAKLNIATQRLAAEFGRLTEQQKRTAILEQTLGVQTFNAETNRYHAELRAWESEMKALGLFDEMDSFFDIFIRPTQTPPMPEPPQGNTPFNPLKGNIRPIPTNPKNKTSSKYNAARSEGLALIKKHPDKAEAIRKRFFDTYGVPLK